MDSLNMNNLASSLPSSAIVKAEQDTMDKFKAAAQSLTWLYRSSQRASKRHFDAGYATALDDLLSVIQHGVSAGSDPNIDDSGGNEATSIGRILDWIEARQESIRIKARDEEEDDDEKLRETKSRNAGAVSTSGPSDVRDRRKLRPIESATSSPPISTHRLAEEAPTRQPPKPCERLASVSPTAPTSSPSPTSPSGSVAHSSGAPSTLPARPQTRARLRQHALVPLNMNSTNSSTSVSDSVLPPSPLMSSIIGAKRRHAAMLLDSCTPASAVVPLSLSGFNGTSTTLSLPQDSTPRDFPSSGIASSSPVIGQRRRVRNSRVNNPPRTGNLNDGHTLFGGDMQMDVEEDSGRDRKRVTRR